MTTAVQDAASKLASQPDADEDQQEQEATGATGGALFDRSQYDREDLQIAKIDGQTVDKIRIDFTGSIMLDRSDPADVALFNRIHLTGDCELRVAGKVSGFGGGYTTGKEGDLDAIVGRKTVKVTTVYVLTPEEL